MKTRIDYREYGLADVNWEDDTLNTNIGNIDGSDPSKEGYAKGYNMDPYEYRLIAKKENKKMKSRLLKRRAAVEIMDITYTPKNYVEELLTLYKQTDGSLQNFFDGFTSNGKIDNKTKKQMCEILKEMGYEIKPTLLDENVKFADLGIDKVRDLQIQDSSLSRMENMLSGNADPTTRPNKGCGFGYDEISQTRSDIGGVPPTTYEITSRLKKK